MTKIHHTFLTGLMVLCAAGCSTNSTANAQTASDRNQVVRAEKLHPTANLSYKVAGVRYQPRKNVEGFTQTGRASWYGVPFHGRRTSNGERYDMNKLTAAHPTLPIPSYARVTNLANGRTVVVRINDRGPFHGNRVMDLSRAAAQQLGFVNAGTANVRVEALRAGDSYSAPRVQMAENKSGAATRNNGNPDIFVNVRSFAQASDARAFMRVAQRHLSRQNEGHRTVMVKQQGGGYTVRIGPFREQQRADEIHRRLKQEII